MNAVITALCATAMLGATAHAGGNLLINADFEDTDLMGAPDVYGAAGWTAFDNAFTVDSSALTTGPLGGMGQSLKMFGFGGVFQDFAATEGQEWNAGVFMLNDSSDPMGAGQVAAINIEWRDGAGDLISFIGNGTFTGADAPVDEWLLQTVTGSAPAGTASARIVLITGNFIPAPGGGAPHFDNAFAEVIPAPGSAALLGLGGLVATRRRRG